MKMKKILLVLSTTRKSPESVSAAIEAAEAASAQLVILFVVDRQLSDKVIRQLTEEGWIGGSPSERLYRAMQAEYVAQAEVIVREIQQQAERAGVSARPLIREGDFIETVLKVIAEEDVEQVILTRRHRSRLSRILFGSAVAEIQRRSPRPVKIIDE